jgi:hypothetical protein
VVPIWAHSRDAADGTADGDAAAGVADGVTAVGNPEVIGDVLGEATDGDDPPLPQAARVIAAAIAVRRSRRGRCVTRTSCGSDASVV